MTASTDSLESVTEKDRQLVQLLNEKPMLTNAQIARRLGLSRQAVSERRKKLEREGVIQRYVYWNIVPKLGLTKHFEITVDGEQEKGLEELTEYLISSWRVSLAWSSSQKVVSGIVLTKREDLFTKIIKDEFPFVRDIKLQSVHLVSHRKCPARAIIRSSCFSCERRLNRCQNTQIGRRGLSR